MGLLLFSPRLPPKLLRMGSYLHSGGFHDVSGRCTSRLCGSWAPVTLVGCFAPVSSLISFTSLDSVNTQALLLYHVLSAASQYSKWGDLGGLGTPMSHLWAVP